MIFQGANTPSDHNPNNHIEAPNPCHNDSISCLAWNPNIGSSQFLATGSWDSSIRVWEVGGKRIEGRFMKSVGAPVLSCCWDMSGTKIFGAGCSNVAFAWDLNRGDDPVPIAQHDAPVKYVKNVIDNNIILTGSWDKTLKYWDLRTPPAPVMTVPLQDRLYSADVRNSMVFVATAERHINIYKLDNPQKILRSLESPLKFQSRCIKAFPDASGFALGSVEGRVAMHHVEVNNRNNNFAYKCHRDTQKNIIYSVNDISFSHMGTLATIGSDGAFVFWDKDSKKLLKDFKRGPLPLTCGEFNHNTTLFAYAASYDWSKGTQAYDPTKMVPRLFVYEVPEHEIRPRK